MPLTLSNPATRHLGGYLDFLLSRDEIAGEVAEQEVIATVLLDLVALALGARRDAAELARARGLRAARVQAIVAEIRAGFSSPGFSVRDVAAKLGIAPRSVQNLLIDTGSNFTERVLELRLQNARRMLADRRHDPAKIGDIAYACGFNEVPYFNRCFRRRFGCSPREYRNGNGGTP
jgi:AraC-like DNA-binding protein